MNPVTQVLLYISYAVLAIAVALVPPRLMDVDQSTTSVIAMFVFFLAWQLNNWFVARETIDIAGERLDRMEDIAKMLRHDLEKTKRNVNFNAEDSDLKSQQLVTELQVLQTLLSQVMEREQDFGARRRAKESVARQQTVSAAADNTVSPMMADTATEDTIDTSTDGDTVVRSSSGANVRMIESEEKLLSVVHASLAENRVDLYLQSVVTLPNRQPRFYECFSRVRDEEGNVILPSQYLEVAEKTGMIGTIDNLLLFRLIQLVRRLGPRKPDTRFFCNMSATSMADSEFFPQFVEFMATNNEFSDRLVFEISQDDYKKIDDETLDRLFSLSRHGYAFSMDQITDLDFDFLSLARQNFMYAKADIEHLMRNREDVEVLKAFLARNNIKLIASHMEHEDHVLDAIDASIEFAQGFKFDEPRPVSEMDRDF
ncbi:hypothetical protein GCM10017044_09230 [Kordiimonas sediminis]|uniref:EAL domain-containing protein n=1 Tax=Kordiimonas sediminis TaxID=1735581 RepID=A0A919APJ2_9PROT|nr:EAL domain-containing protein [Kordiimonas sediminis]GHF17031.1 hypothetical protein GCM10017044_09230 [Kordiimonas sediminis]